MRRNMNPEGLERPRNLREFRARLNLVPTRYIIGKPMGLFCEGERPAGRLHGNGTVFIDRFHDTCPYNYEEVNLSTITENDVVLFADADIPFWIADGITEKTITFTPCGVWKRTGERMVFGVRRDPRANIYQYTKRPMRTSMDICDKYFIEHPDRANMDKILNVRTIWQPSFTVKKTKFLRNGDIRQIKVRKFTGTEEQMILHAEESHEVSHQLYDVSMFKSGTTLYERNARNEFQTTNNSTIGDWADQYA